MASRQCEHDDERNRWAPGGDGPGGAPATWTWERVSSGSRPSPDSRENYGGKQRATHRPAPWFFPASSVPSGELDGPDVTTVTPLSTAGRGQRLEEGNKQESEKAEAIYQAVGEGPEEVGRRTAGCPAH